MRIIPVIDLRRGRAVRGRSGERHRYVPVQSRLAGPRGGDLSDPLDLLVVYRDVLGIDTVYVADLDRIEGRGENDALLFRLLETVPTIRLLWDGGLTGATSGIGVCRNGRIAPVIGTETLRSIESLRSVQRPATAPRPVLSLDLNAGRAVERGGDPAAGSATRCAYRHSASSRSGGERRRSAARAPASSAARRAGPRAARGRGDCLDRRSPLPARRLIPGSSPGDGPA